VRKIHFSVGILCRQYEDAVFSFAKLCKCCSWFTYNTHSLFLSLSLSTRSRNEWVQSDRLLGARLCSHLNSEPAVFIRHTKATRCSMHLVKAERLPFRRTQTDELNDKLAVMPCACIGVLYLSQIQRPANYPMLSVWFPFNLMVSRDIWCGRSYAISC